MPTMRSVASDDVFRKKSNVVVNCKLRVHQVAVQMGISLPSEELQKFALVLAGMESDQ